PDATIRIVSPGDDAYISGGLLLRALLDPPGAARDIARVDFYADGKLVCRIDALPYECEWDAGEMVVEHQVRVVATRLDGTRLVHNVRTRGTEYAETVQVDAVQVTATVTDGRGRFVQGLSPEVFRVFENDRRQQITHFETENIPLELVVAVDVSGSMGPSMATLKQSVRRFLDALDRKHQVTLLAFNDSIFTLARRAADPAVRFKAVDRLAPWGGTALYDVLVKAIDLLGRQVGRRAVVVFTDGDDQSSHVTLEEATRRVEASDATVYMIGQGRGTAVHRLKEIMEKLATVSGGRAFGTDRVSELDEAFGRILDELSHQYLLAYAPSNTLRDGSWRRIRLDVADGQYKVRARQGYRAMARR
ncbi:MAG: VWA domain-containing protein, partial [Acidobacteria bacterium]|nr:VWA domain-containing protein [Acidobacteriota bacterium]